jgi:hypothetical protein
VLAPAEVREQFDRARSIGLVDLCRKAERRHHLPRFLLLAVASRETNCRDVVGDGGHGRGVFQIDDRFHGEWLAEHGAVSEGTVPALPAAADYAARMLATALALAEDHELGGRGAAKFAAAAYNAGIEGAIEGLRAGDADARTTGHDYGSDVIWRMQAFRKLDTRERAE